MNPESLPLPQRATPAPPYGDLAGHSFRLPVLPYPPEALEPYLSAVSFSFHYGKHHHAYVGNLNKMVSGTAYAALTLEDLIRKTSGMPDKTAIFNNASQVWNHTFFWHSMRPGGGGQPNDRLMAMIAAAFGSYEAFKNAFMTAAVGQFSNGGVWLVQDGDKVRIVKTSNAETPVVYGQNALLTCDLWEHAYYIDYQNRRKDYVQNYLDHLVNWDFAVARMTC